MAGPLKVLIAGGGVAALEAAFALRALAEDRVDVEVLAPEAEFVYRPLAVAEPFRVGDVPRFPLGALVDGAGARLRRGRLVGVAADRGAAVTSEWKELNYDVLLLALGAVAREAMPGALTFRGPQDGPALGEVLRAARTGRMRRMVFAAPQGVSWPLPIYELALLTRLHLTAYDVTGVSIALVTAEDEPLRLFGSAAVDAIKDLLEIEDVRLHTGARPLSFDGGKVHLDSGEALDADHVVALPVLEGPRLRGVPKDDDGFVPIDDLGLVEGLVDVYAAGDMTQFPVKQGGLATQQADAAASAVAALAGAPVEPAPFRPVLRGLLLTGGLPRYLRGEGGGGDAAVDAEALWWPPAKIVGRYLAPYLAARAGIREPSTWVPDIDAIPVDVELELGPTGARPVA